MFTPPDDRNSIHPADYKHIVFFTGAGMSAESGVPTYRGKGGVWHKYNWEDYACQAAFILDPEAVLDFHETRRRVLIDCLPHAGHELISNLENNHESVWIITQNIDGMHQRAGSKNIVELHGSAWRLRCDHCEVVIDDHNPDHYKNWKCDNDHWLRPDIIWFNDFLIPAITQKADEIISKSDLFISIGTSGVVWPAAGFPQIAKSNGATLIEINPEPSEQNDLYDHVFRGKASDMLNTILGKSK